MKLSQLSDLSALQSQPSNAEKVVRKGYDGKKVRLKIELDTKARRGKTVTRISGFQARPGEVEEMATKLKKLCGSGGSVGDNLIDLQGDHREKVRHYLSSQGYECVVR